VYLNYPANGSECGMNELIPGMSGSAGGACLKSRQPAPLTVAALQRGLRVSWAQARGDRRQGRPFSRSAHFVFTPRCSQQRSACKKSIRAIQPAIVYFSADGPAVRISKSAKGKRWGERRAFVLIALITTFPVVLTHVLISLSSRPDLYYVTPQPVERGVKPISWETLDKLLSHDNHFMGDADTIGVKVEVAGYMVTAEGSHAVEGRVAQFLLVPNPGNWLHAPHLHPSEVIDVLLTDARTTPLHEREPVIVCGTLSFGSMDSTPRRAVCHLRATAVQAFVR